MGLWPISKQIMWHLSCLRWASINLWLFISDVIKVYSGHRNKVEICCHTPGGDEFFASQLARASLLFFCVLGGQITKLSTCLIQYRGWDSMALYSIPPPPHISLAWYVGAGTNLPSLYMHTLAHAQTSPVLWKWLSSHGEVKDFSCRFCVQNISEAHPASYPLNTGGLFPEHLACFACSL
jgi:hypothetical protein